MKLRTKEIKIRLSDAEYQQLLERKTEPTLAGWLRTIALDQKAKKQAKTVDPKLLYELNKIGVNMNQLAKLANAKYLDGQERIKLLASLAIISEQLEKVLNNAG